MEQRNDEPGRDQEDQDVLEPGSVLQWSAFRRRGPSSDARPTSVSRLSCSTLSNEAHRVDRRQMGADELPALAAAVAGPQRAGGRAHGEPRSGLVDVEAVAIDEVVGVALG